MKLISALNSSPPYLLFIFLISFLSCNLSHEKNDNASTTESSIIETTQIRSSSGPFLIVLGTIQDAGSPQLGCQKICCNDLWKHPDLTRKVVSLGVYDPIEKKKYLFDATPDLPAQLEYFDMVTNTDSAIPDGIFLTHAHIGHYTGLMYLGREAFNSSKANVFVMPRLKFFLESNGPWSQLVLNNNIVLKLLADDVKIILSPTLSVTPILVPHRDEYSETVGYYIHGPKKTVLFIPDIDKWSKWNRNIVEEIEKIDFALLDGSFYSGQELNNRDMSEIPHPSIAESMSLFNTMSLEERSKVHFIHFNHTNPMLQKGNKEAMEINQNGYNIATFGQIIEL